MKRISITLAWFFISFFSVCQVPPELIEKELNQAKKEIDEQALYLREGLEYKDDYISEFQKKVSIEFTVDTFRIERLCSKRLDLDFSTAGMVQAVNSLNSDYDKLLNKYYKMLYAGLDPDDRLILKQTQKNWLAFRDSEKKLINTLRNEKYSGGGTLQNIFNASYIMELTKKRVLEIVSYLTDMADR